MKKMILILSALFLVSVSAIAEPKQEINNEQSYAVINLQKAPKNENKQSIKNTKSWFCINIIINGKIKDNNSSK